VPSDGGSIPPTSTNEGFERIPRSPGTLTQKGFPGFFICGIVRPRALQVVRPWGAMPPLTHLALRRAKPAEKTQNLFDRGGLYLEISSC